MNMKTVAPARPYAMSVSQKRLRTFLRNVIVLLLVTYVYITLRIYSMRESEGGSGISLSSPSKGASSLDQPRIPWGCASTLLVYYLSAALLWNVVLFSRRRKRQRAAMHVNVAVLVAISILQSSGDYCEMTGELTGGPAIIARRIDGISWSDSYLPDRPMEGNVRISFRLHDPEDIPYPDKFSGVVGYRCGDKADLPPSLSKRTVLDFTTTIATDLKLLFLGDSIAEQFAQAFDAAVLGGGHERNRLAKTYRNGPPRKDGKKGGINVHNCLSVAAPIRGGGVSAFWRIATLMSASTRRDVYRCEHKWTTWNEEVAYDILDHRYSDKGKALDYRRFRPEDVSNVTFHSEDFQYSVKTIDAIVLRVPHGWLTIQQITEERIVEAINLSSEHVGAQTVIVSTLPLNNNVMTLSDWEGISKINHMIREIARGWIPRPGRARWVLVQEFGNFTNQVLRMSAEHLQMANGSTPDFAQDGWELQGADFLLKRLSSETFWYPSICMVCADKTYARIDERSGREVEDCLRNKISRDGTHWCVETLASRYSASLACLLGCVYNGIEPSSSAEDVGMVRQCERKCNEQFMSLVPAEDDWVGTKMSLYSKSL